MGVEPTNAACVPLLWGRRYIRYLYIFLGVFFYLIISPFIKYKKQCTGDSHKLDLLVIPFRQCITHITIDLFYITDNSGPNHQALAWFVLRLPYKVDSESCSLLQKFDNQIVLCPFFQTVSMIQKYHNHTLQTNPRYREKESQTIYSNNTSVRQ